MPKGDEEEFQDLLAFDEISPRSAADVALYTRFQHLADLLLDFAPDRKPLDSSRFQCRFLLCDGDEDEREAVLEWKRRSSIDGWNA